MAAATREPPRSSASGGGGSADSYIGSLISLISKSEIRYEGVVYNINTQESTIGLRNVKSFGTERRKKDGPQVPPSDKVYEFILFRGSDIKDLQVKPSPSVPPTTAMHNDPAIIQSYYPQAASVSMSLPSSGTESLTSLDPHTSSLGLSRPTFQSSLPLYQPSGSLGSWGSSPPPPTTNGSGLAMPMYWQGYYGLSNGLQAQQQTLLRPPPALSMPPSMQQSMQYSVMNSSNFSASQPLENPPHLLPPLNTGTLNSQSTMLPARSSAIVSDSSNIIPDKAATQTLPTVTPSNNLALASPLNTALDKSAIAFSGSEKCKAVLDSVMPLKSMPEPLSSIARTSSSVLNEGVTPSLVTPGQFLHPGLPAVPSLQSSQTAQKDVDVVQASLPESPPQPSAAPVTEMWEPMLPPASPPEHKLHGAPMYTHHASRRGLEKGRGNGISRSATRFTEDFDFTAMNEKFNKDEVWGHLGKGNKAQEDGDSSQDEDSAGSSKSEMKPVYVKDEFFDSLSCDALDGGSRNGRARFSEQLRRDTETFGDFSRHQGGRGGWGLGDFSRYRGGRGVWGPGRGGRSRGGYHRRGYGYVGRGQGYNMSTHPSSWH